MDGACRPSCETGFAACGAPEQGCTTELATSLRHCGKCGAACESGYCRGGTCTEPTTVTTGLDASRLGFSVGEALFVYQPFSLPVSATLFWRIPSAGGAKTPVTVKGMYALAVDGTHWYGCKAPVTHFDGDCRLSRAPMAGGPVQEIALVERASLLPGTVAVDGDNVYLHARRDEDVGTIVAVPLGGGAPRELLSATSVLALTAKDGDVAWSGAAAGAARSSGVFALRKGAEEPVKLDDLGVADAVALADGYVYVAQAITGVRRVALKGGAVEWLARTGGHGENPEGTPAGIAVTSGHVYFGLLPITASSFELRRIEVPTARPTF